MVAICTKPAVRTNEPGAPVDVPTVKLLVPILRLPAVSVNVARTIKFLLAITPCPSLIIKLFTSCGPEGISLNEPVCSELADGP